MEFIGALNKGRFRVTLRVQVLPFIGLVGLFSYPKTINNKDP